MVRIGCDCVHQCKPGRTTLPPLASNEIEDLEGGLGLVIWVPHLGCNWDQPGRSQHVPEHQRRSSGLGFEHRIHSIGGAFKNTRADVSSAWRSRRRAAAFCSADLRASPSARVPLPWQMNSKETPESKAATPSTESTLSPTSQRTPEEDRFLADFPRYLERCGEPPMTVKRESLVLSQAGTLGDVKTSQPTGQVFMAPMCPKRPRAEPCPGDHSPGASDSAAEAA